MKPTTLLLFCTLIVSSLIMSCNTEKYEELPPIGDFTFVIDSIYNVTETSFTVRTRFHATSTARLKRLHIFYESEDMSDSGNKYFDKMDETMVITLDKLQPNTIYEIIPMAEITTNSGLNESSSGPFISFMQVYTHGPLQSSGTVNDIDGNTYHYITIGTQTWMVENLKTRHFRDRRKIDYQPDSLTGENNKYGYCYYNNDSTKYAGYGLIYGYGIINEECRIAPAGWHVPSAQEWDILNEYLFNHGYACTPYSTDVAKALASQTNDWTDVSQAQKNFITNNLALNNKSGFTALPGGYRDRKGKYMDFGRRACFWSTTSLDSDTPYIYYMNYYFLSSSSSTLNYDSSRNLSGMYIRCIRDNL